MDSPHPPPEIYFHVSPTPPSPVAQERTAAAREACVCGVGERMHEVGMSVRSGGGRPTTPRPTPSPETDSARPRALRWPLTGRSSGPQPASNAPAGNRNPIRNAPDAASAATGNPIGSGGPAAGNRSRPEGRSGGERRGEGRASTGSERNLNGADRARRAGSPPAVSCFHQRKSLNLHALRIRVREGKRLIPRNLPYS